MFDLRTTGTVGSSFFCARDRGRSVPECYRAPKLVPERNSKDWEPFTLAKWFVP